MSVIATTDPKVILAELEAAGTEQNHKIYARHGVDRPMYGVNIEVLRKIGKRLKIDHELARALWASGNHDARVLATMVADPAHVSVSELNTWAKDLDNYIVSDAFATFLTNVPKAPARMRVYMRSPKEWVARVGWAVLARFAMKDDAGGLSEHELGDYIGEIESKIHESKNRVRDSMNAALISVALHSDPLRALALDAAGRIGKVHVDHGKTGCKTPDAASYIVRAFNHPSAKRNRRKKTKA